MNLWIITVNFGETSATKSLIDSLSSLINFESVKIGIADNAATDKTSYHLKQIADSSKLDIEIFSNQKNLYYWPAAKRVIKKLKKIYKFYPDWIIVCNNDITFTDQNFLKKLSNLNKKEYPIVGPRIIDSDGHDLNPFMNTPLSKFQYFFWELYFISYSTSILISFFRNFIKFFMFGLKTKTSTINKQVYAVHGSMILFSNHFFEKGGYLDDGFDMYGEELTLAEIAINLNFKITYCNDLKIIHHAHSTTKLLDNRLLFLKAKQSFKYFRSTYLK